MERTRILGLKRNIFFTGLTSFLTDTSTKMVYSIMPLFLVSIGASRTAISLIEGIAESTAALVKAGSGVWSDRIRRNKPFMVLGYGVTALVTPLYSAVRSSVHVLLARFLERIGKGLRAAPRDSLIGRSIERAEAGKSFGFHKAMDNSGAILGPLLASVLLSVFPSGYRYVFLLATVPAVLGVVSIAAFIREPTPAAGPEDVRRPSIRDLPPRFFLFLGIVVVFTLGNSTDALLLVRTSETGIAPSFVPFVYMIFNGVSVLAAVPLGALSDRIGREALIITGFLVYALVYFLFGAYRDLGLYIGLFVLYGLYSGLTDGTLKAFVSDLVGAELKGTAFGLYHAVLGVSLLPASLAAGVLYDSVSPRAAFHFGSGLAAAAALLMTVFTLTGRKDATRTRT